MTIILERPETSLYYQRGNENFMCCGVTSMAVSLNQPFKNVWQYLYANVMPFEEIYPVWLGQTTTLDRTAFYASLGVGFEHLDYHPVDKVAAEKEIAELNIRPRQPFDLDMLKQAPSEHFGMTVGAWSNTIAKRDVAYEVIAKNHVVTFCNGMVFDQGCKDNKFRPMDEHCKKFSATELSSTCVVNSIPDDIGERLAKNLAGFPGALTDIVLPDFHEVFPGFALVKDHMSGMETVMLNKPLLMGD